MKFENLSEEDKKVFLEGDYKPVSALFGENIPNWHYYDFLIDTNIKKEIFVSDLKMIHKIPIKSHVYIFRWKMPRNPQVYQNQNDYTDDMLKSFVFRFTVGGKPLEIEDSYIKQIARGEVSVDNDFLIDLNKQLDKTFTFNIWKIPFCHVTTDEYDFKNVWSAYEGNELIKIQNLEKKLIAEQESKKQEILNQTKETIKKFPDYLSLIRLAIQGKISIEEAAKEAGSKDIIVKGI